MTLTRRDFLKLGGIGAAGLALGIRTPASPGPGLRILALPGSVHPGLAAPKGFGNHSGLTVGEIELAPNPDVLRARLATHPGRYDLVLPPAFLTAELIVAGALLPLDPVRVPAAGSLSPAFERGRRPQDPANAYSLPAATGAIGLLFRAEHFARPPDSWASLRDHAARLAVPDDPQLVVGNYLRVQEPSALNPSPLALQAIRPALHHIRRRARVEVDPVAALLAGRADLAVGPSALAVWHGLAFALPVEGSCTWVVDYAIPAGAPQPDGAHAFIDFALTYAPPAPPPTLPTPGFLTAQRPLLDHVRAARAQLWDSLA